MSLLLVGIRSPDHAANLRYARGADPEAARAAPAGREPGDLQHPRSARLLPAQQVALRLGGRPRVDPRSPAQRDQQAQEPAVRVAGRRRAGRPAAAAPRAQRTASTSASPAACSPAPTASTSGSRRCRPGGLFVEHAGEALYDAAAPADRRGPADAVPPADEGRGRRGPSRPASPTARRSSSDIVVVTISCVLIVVALDRPSTSAGCARSR